MGDKIRMNRRSVLAALGTIGAAGALGGAGTMALFNDREEFTGNRLTAGELDLLIDWQQRYYGPEGWVDVNAWPDLGGDGVQDDVLTFEEYAAGGGAGGKTYDLEDPSERKAAVKAYKEMRYFIDADDVNAPAPLIDLRDVKPGDKGEVTFSLHLFDNPGYIRLVGDATLDDENGQNEPELEAEGEDTDGLGELDDVIEVTLWYDDGDNELEASEAFDGVDVDGDDRIIYQGTLADAFEMGVLLDADPTTEGTDCFEGCHTYHVGFMWELPRDVGNEVQSDLLEFSLGFEATQCRHNTMGQYADLSTGHAEWLVTSLPGDGATPFPAVVTDPHPAWVTADCAEWIDPYGNDAGASDPVGTYGYETIFEVKPSSEDYAVHVRAFSSDNPVTLYLDGTEIGSFAGSRSFDSLHGPLTEPVAAGSHTLEAVVENQTGTGSNPTGLLVCAELLPAGDVPE